MASLNTILQTGDVALDASGEAFFVTNDDGVLKVERQSGQTSSFDLQLPISIVARNGDPDVAIVIESPTLTIES
jgi:hypothetical protein